MDAFDDTGRFDAAAGANPRLARLDGAELLTRLHREGTRMVLDLLDGFFTNAEDALFELAYRCADPQRQQQSFDLMRRLRERRPAVQQVFASMLQRSGSNWLTGSGLARNDDSEVHAMHQRADLLAEKASAHFSLLLELLRQRTARLTPRPIERVQDMPLAPAMLARGFLAAAASMDLGRDDLDTVLGLFQRLVMDRLGPVYGHCHVFLVHAGVPADEEASAGDSLNSIGGHGATAVAEASPV